MTQIEELGKLFDDFSGLFDQLSALQQQKIEAAQQDDLNALDRCMQREQAISLQFRGMQRKKDALHQSMGLENVSLRQLPDRLSKADRAQIAPAITQFQNSYALYCSTAAASRAFLETTLQEINRALDESKTPEKPSGKHGNFTDIKA